MKDYPLVDDTHEIPVKVGHEDYYLLVHLTHETPETNFDEGRPWGRIPAGPLNPWDPLTI